MNRSPYCVFPSYRQSQIILDKCLGTAGKPWLPVPCLLAIRGVT